MLKLHNEKHYLKHFSVIFFRNGWSNDAPLDNQLVVMYELAVVYTTALQLHRFAFQRFLTMITPGDF